MLAIALLGALVVGVFGATLDTRLAALQVPPEIRRALNAEAPRFAEAKVPPQIEGEQRRRLEKVLDESFVRSFRVAMLVAAGLALASALCALVMIHPRLDASFALSCAVVTSRYAVAASAGSPWGTQMIIQAEQLPLHFFEANPKSRCSIM